MTLYHMLIEGRATVILDDPVLNFLNLLVGLAGGWMMSQVSRAEARGGTWAPAIAFIWLVGAVVGTWLLDLTLGLREHLAMMPYGVGVFIGLAVWHPRRRREGR